MQNRLQEWQEQNIASDIWEERAELLNLISYFQLICQNRRFLRTP